MISLAEMVPLSEILPLVEQRFGLKLYAGNLTTSRAGRPSVMEQLAAEQLARPVDAGRRRRWLISPQAISRLVALATGGRRGPAPGAQVTLDAQQFGLFARTVAAAADPAAAVHEALAAATGWPDDVIERVERIVIPVSPRRPIPNEE